MTKSYVIHSQCITPVVKRNLLIIVQILQEEPLVYYITGLTLYCIYLTGGTTCVLHYIYLRGGTTCVF